MKPAIKGESTDICSRCNVRIGLWVRLWSGMTMCLGNNGVHTPKNHIQMGEKWYFKPDFNEYLELL